MPNNSPTAAETKAAADKAAADKAAKDKAATLAKAAPAKAAPAVKAPFVVMSDDKFILKDTNSDGINDTVVVEQADYKVKKEEDKFKPFFKAISDARTAAAAANTGHSAAEVTAAEDLAEAKVRASWKGPKPGPTQAELDVAAAKKAEEALKPAIDAELAKIAEKKA